MSRILIVEDSAGKKAAISEVVAAACSDAELFYAATVVEAERAIAKGGWALIVLDISMDIAPSELGAKSRGQANIGGLSIAQRMFLLEREAPTIIVTAFDSFAAPTMGAGVTEIVGFEEVEERARESLGANLIACLQYNSISWKVEMTSAIKKVFAS